MKIMIIHPGTQHSTKIAVALKSGGSEICLVTTVYKKKKTILSFLYKFLPKNEKKRIYSRINENLNDNEILVLHEFWGLMLLILARLDKKKKIYTKFKQFVSKLVGKTAAKIAVKNNFDAVISFDSYSIYSFEHLNKYGFMGKKIIDYSAAYAPYAKNIYTRIIKNNPKMKISLEAERPVLWDLDYYNDLIQEPKYCDYILCASNYTKYTLTYYGIDSKIVTIIPYGYDSLVENNSLSRNNKFFTILFVGNVSIMKGIPFLIEAFKKINKDDIRLVLIGNIQKQIKEMTEDDNRIIVKGYVPHNMIAHEYCQANLFVFPSLSDGFGFAPLEAMSYEVPCIVTKSSGISDIIEHGKDGFIIDNESIDSIKQILEYCVKNKEKIGIMGKYAKNKASIYTVARYNKSICKYIFNICKNNEISS